MPELLILVVDDDEDILGIVEDILRLAGYRVHTAANGAEALARLRQEQPGLILLDMRMPVMDGWQFASHLRTRYSHTIPLVVMSAARDARDRAREVHADDYITKPFDIDDLVHKVEQNLRPVGST